MRTNGLLPHGVTFMKAVLGLAAGIAALGMAGSASAARSLSPPSTSFQIAGKFVFQLAGDISCTASFSGMTAAPGVKSPAGQITGGSVTAKGKNCNVVVANFPWTVALTSNKGGSISGVTYYIPGGGSCDSETVLLTISKKGVWGLSSGSISGCEIIGSGKSTPPITIAK